MIGIFSLALMAMAALAPPGAVAEPEPRRSVDGMSEAAERSMIAGQARRFMQDYARDLRAGDRAALADRFDRGGAWRLTPDSRYWVRQDWQQIRDTFAAPDWRPPAHFDWFTLDLQVVDRDAVAVAAVVDRGGSGDRAAFHLYSALLVRGRDGFRIRMEHLAPAPPR